MARPLLAALLLCALTACAPRPAAPASDAPDAGAPPAWVEDAVLYEVFVRSATLEGTLRALIPRLDGLRAMGVTTLWLMPIHPVGVEERKGRLGSPYAVRDYRGIDPAFGTPGDFRALVDAVHDRGMFLILDWVANHTARDHAWTRSHPEWYTQDDAGTIVPPAGTDWFDVADLDYGEPALREAMIAEMRYWVEEFDVDGFRFDVAGMVPQDFWEDALAELSSLRPLMLLAEGDEPWLYDAGFDITYAWNTHHALRAIWDGAPADTLAAVFQAEAGRYAEDALRLRFITNHDETSWADAAVTMYDGVEGTKAAMVVAATLPGVPLVYNGQEVAAPQRMNLFEDEKIDWSLTPGLRDFYATLLRLSHESRALREGSFTPLGLGSDVIGYVREHEGERVFVFVNPRAEEQTFGLPVSLPLGPVWRDAIDVFTGEPPPFAVRETLPPYGFRILRSVE